MLLRLATAADLEAMKWVLIGASPLDPIYLYRFPGMHEYPTEFARLCEQKCREYLATSTVVVCEMADDESGSLDCNKNNNQTRRGTAGDSAPDDGGENHATRRVVAFAVWEVPYVRRYAMQQHHLRAPYGGTLQTLISHISD